MPILMEHDLKHIVKEPTCFKNTENPTCIDLFITNVPTYIDLFITNVPTCIDLFITNVPNSFPVTKTITTGLSDFHKMVLTVLKNKFMKLKTKVYRGYKCRLHGEHTVHKYYREVHS